MVRREGHCRLCDHLFIGWNQMSYYVTTAVNVQARKAHRCTWCGEKIHVGERYKRWTCIGDDGPMTNRMHTECYEALRRWAEAQPGEYEYDPGSFTRGCGCALAGRITHK